MKRFTVAFALLAMAVGVAHVEASIIWGLKSKANTIASTPPTELFKFQTDGTSFSDLGALKISGSNIDADGLAVSPNHGLLAFQLTTTGSTLFSIDPNTISTTVLGTTSHTSLSSVVDIRGATFDLSDQLWALDAANDALLQVNPATGAVVGSPVALTLGGVGFNLSTASDIAQRVDGTFYVTSSASLYTLNISTGALTAVGTPDTGQALAGAAFHVNEPTQALFAYEINGSDDVYSYSVGSFPGSRSNLYLNIIPSFNGIPFNAGRGDLAGAITPEPASLVVWSLLIGLTCAGGTWRFFSRRRGQ
jgi:hypothetical protein